MQMLSKLNPRSLLLGSAAFVALSACSYVELKPGAENIVLTNDMVNCKKLAETEVRVTDRYWIWKREIKAVQDELEIVAQNEAVTLGGNAVWPISPITEGRQRFRVMRCP